MSFGILVTSFAGLPWDINYFKLHVVAFTEWNTRIWNRQDELYEYVLVTDSANIARNIGTNSIFMIVYRGKHLIFSLIASYARFMATKFNPRIDPHPQPSHKYFGAKVQNTTFTKYSPPWYFLRNERRGKENKKELRRPFASLTFLANYNFEVDKESADRDGPNTLGSKSVLIFLFPLFFPLDFLSIFIAHPARRSDKFLIQFSIL